MRGLQLLGVLLRVVLVLALVLLLPYASLCAVSILLLVVCVHTAHVRLALSGFCSLAPTSAHLHDNLTHCRVHPLARAEGQRWVCCEESGDKLSE